MVGEVVLLSTSRVASYYGAGDELHLAFNFPPLFAPWEAGAWRERIEEAAEHVLARGAWPTWALSNHDYPRHRSRYGGSETRARAAAVLLATLPGTPFLYAGEELGLEDARIPPTRRVDPGGRDGCRAPLPWEAEPPHGWVHDEAWLPWPPAAGVRNVATERSDAGSMLWLYRRVLAARSASPALRGGGFAWLPAPDGVLAWRRDRGPERRVVLVNFADAPQQVALSGVWRIEVASDGRAEGERYSGGLGREQAVMLRGEA